MKKNLSKHDIIQREIIKSCSAIGYGAIEEFRGKGWRADVYIPIEKQPIAFEVQLSPQSLRRTLERQAKYQADKVNCCWLFEKPVHKLNEERPDLPVFYVEEKEDSSFIINLGERRKVPLKVFLKEYILGNIRFQFIAVAKKDQLIELNFFEMGCWK